MNNYVRLHWWDFLLTVCIAVGMHLNTFSAFVIKDAYMTNYLLVFLVTTAVTALMFVLGYNKRNTIIGAVGGGVLFVGWIIYLRVSGQIHLTEGSDETIPAFWTILLFGTAVVYLLTRNRKVLYVAAPIALLFCGIFRFLKYPVSTFGLFLLVSGLLLKILFLTYRDSLLSATYGNFKMSHFITQSVAIVTVLVLLSSGAYFGIVKPLDPPTQDLKLVSKLMQFDVLKLLGVASTQEIKDPNQNEDQDKDDDKPQDQEQQPEEEQQDKQNRQQNQTRQSDEKIDASAVSYQQKNYTAVWVTVLILLVLATPFAVKYVLRVRRKRRLRGLDASNQAAYVYDFFLTRLKRLGAGKSNDQTVLEYAEQQEAVLEQFTAKDGTTFEEISEVYSRYLYSGAPVTDEEAASFLAMYASFYPNARAFVGHWKYLWKFWVL